MSQLIGTYTHLRNENLEEYYQTLGVPYVARKMMALTHPKLIIGNENDEWTITTTTMIRTLTVKFKFGEEYDEDMPKGTLKSTTTQVNEGAIKTESIGPDNMKIIRTYECTEEGCVLILKHVESGTEARRYFKRE